jgi:hypothetical protein
VFCGVRVPGLALGISASTGLRGIGPALAGNVGAGWAFALSRDGNQDVDVPMLAPARSRCRWVAWGPVPLWDGLIVANEEKQSSLSRCVVVMALRALGWCGVRSAPTGHRIPARGETPGMAHNRSVLKERRITPGAHTCFAVAECRGWRWGSVPRRGSAGSVLRSQGTLGPAGLSRYRATGIRMSTFLCSLRPGPAAAGLLMGMSLYGGGLIVANEEKQSSLTRCVVVMALRALGWCGVRSAQRGTAYQPGVKPRVCRTTGAF